MKKVASVVTLFFAAALSACGNMAHPGSTADRELLRSRVTAAMSDFQRTDPSLSEVINKAHAYVIFPRIVTPPAGAAMYIVFVQQDSRKP